MKKIIILLMLMFSYNVYATEVPVDVLNMDIESIQRAHSDGLFTYDQLMQFYIDRINAYDEDYNAIISINPDAINEAKEMEKLYKEKGLISEIMGLPVIIKDNIDFVKLPTTVGTKSLKDNYPKKNSKVVDKITASGGIILAKSNMSEFAFSANNSLSSYGHVRNAYNKEYSPYGSSGGSAVSVALGFAPLALGTDTNASVRTPASANDVVGFRPACKSVSSSGVVKYDSSRDVVGPIARYANDAKILYDIIKEDIYKKSKDPIKIGVLKSYMKETSSGPTPLSSTYKPIIDLMNDAIKVLSHDYEIVDIDKFYNYNYDSLVRNSYSGILMCYDFNQYIKNTKSKIKSFSELISTPGHIQNLSGYNEYCYNSFEKTAAFARKKENKEKFRKYVDQVMDENDVDVLIYPTTKNKILKISEIYKVHLKTNSYSIAPSTCYPSMNVSIGFSDDLPYGMEILSKTDDVGKIFDIALNYYKSVNHYKLPEEAKNLYKIPSSVTTLVDYYQKYKSIKYEKVREQTKEFFDNYEEINNKEEKSKELVSTYEKIKKNFLKFDIDKNNLNYSLVYIFSYYCLIVIIYLFIIRKLNKKIKFKNLIKLFIII